VPCPQRTRRQDFSFLPDPINVIKGLYPTSKAGDSPDRDLMHQISAHTPRASPREHEVETGRAGVRDSVRIIANTRLSLTPRPGICFQGVENYVFGESARGLIKLNSTF